MVYGDDDKSGYGPTQPGEARFDPEATQVVPAPQQYPPHPQQGHQPPYGQPVYPAPTHPYSQPGQPPQPAGHYPPPNPYRPPPTQAFPGAYQPYGQPPAEPPPASRRGWLIAGVAVAVVVLLALGGVGVSALLTSDGPKPKETTAADPEPTAASPAPTPSDAASPAPSPTGPSQSDIASRATDPKPLTLAEVFPGRAITFNGTTYQILGRDLVTDCGTAAGGNLSTALVSARCNQIVRATVTDPSSQYLVTVGIANLPDEAAADQIYKLLDDPAKNGYFNRLNGTGKAKDFASTRDTIIGSLARGHYVIYAVGGRAGSTSASLADEQLKTTLKDMRLYANESITKRSFE